MRLLRLAPALLVACAQPRDPLTPQPPVEVAAVAPAPPASSAPLQPLPAASSSSSAVAPQPAPSALEPAPFPFPAGSVSSASSSTPSALSPPFRVRAVLVIPAVNPVPADPFHGDRFMMFEAPATCAAARGLQPPRHLETTAEPVAGSSAVFTLLSLSGGITSYYRGQLTIVSAPKKPKSKGRVRVDPMPDGNVEGGELEATWCPDP